MVIEPLIQGAAGMRPWPRGLLAAVRRWCDAHGVLLIADEVMTGFGRTGTMFAFQQEGAVPDFLALAKGLTGGYLPLAATLVPEKIFTAFQEDTFYYGHSYCGNQLGCAAGLASLRIFQDEQVLENLQPKIAAMGALLERIGRHPRVKEIRQCGFIAGIEVESGGAEVCLAARQFGLLTRPILDTVVLMPPLCITLEELERAVAAIEQALAVAARVNFAAKAPSTLSRKGSVRRISSSFQPGYFARRRARPQPRFPPAPGCTCCKPAYRLA